MNENLKTYTFEDLGIDKNISKSLKEIGFLKPFPIQISCIPDILSGFDILGISRTGSGKTAAFVIPLLSKIIPENYPQVLIIEPTRELAIQVGNVFLKISKLFNNYIKIITIYGGIKYNEQINIINSGVHVIISTPGRLLDYIDNNKIDISKVDKLVLDESDEMLKSGFINDIYKIIKFISKKRQIIFFSATMSNKLKNIALTILNKPKQIILSNKDNNYAKIEQNYCYINRFKKKETLLYILDNNNFESLIIFVNTKYLTTEISSFLRKYGYSSIFLNGDMSQVLREKTISFFRNKKYKILVATDIASRGLDISSVDLIINYDLPLNFDIYVHRIGRTGRGDKYGKSILFLDQFNVNMLNNIKKYYKNITINKISIPKIIDLKEIKLNLLIKKMEQIKNLNSINNNKHILNLILNKFNSDIELVSLIMLKIILK